MCINTDIYTLYTCEHAIISLHVSLTREKIKKQQKGRESILPCGILCGRSTVGGSVFLFPLTAGRYTVRHLVVGYKLYYFFDSPYYIVYCILRIVYYYYLYTIHFVWLCSFVVTAIFSFYYYTLLCSSGLMITTTTTTTTITMSDDEPAEN